MYELDDFEKALAHFGTRVDIIIAMEIGGKLDADAALIPYKKASFHNYLKFHHIQK